MWLCFNIFLDLLIAYNALFILFLTNLICAFQSSLLSKYKTRNLTSFLRSILSFAIVKLKLSALLILVLLNST